MNRRTRPYTARGIRRVPCARCGQPSSQQWQVCADDNCWRGVCLDCDIALNRLVLEWMGFAQWQEMSAEYERQMKGRT